MGRRKTERKHTAPRGRKALVLPAECLIADADALRRSLVALVKTADVSLDASSVQRIDTASLQVLAAFVRERIESARAFQWVGVTPAFAERVTLLGLAEALALPGPAEVAA